MSKKHNGSSRGDNAAKVAGLTSATLGAGSLVAAGTALALSPTGRHKIVRRVRKLSRGSAQAVRRVADSSPVVEDFFPANGSGEKWTSKNGDGKAKKNKKKAKAKVKA